MHSIYNYLTLQHHVTNRQYSTVTIQFLIYFKIHLFHPFQQKNFLSKKIFNAEHFYFILSNKKTSSVRRSSMPIIFISSFPTKKTSSVRRSSMPNFFISSIPTKDFLSKNIFNADYFYFVHSRQKTSPVKRS